MGKIVGHLASLVQGAAEFAAATTGEIGGGLLVLSGVGTVAGAPAIAAATAVGVHGVAVGANAGSNLLADIREMTGGKGSGGSSRSSEPSGGKSDSSGKSSGDGSGELNYQLKAQDKDWRGSGNTHQDALNDAFKNTGVDRSEFTATEWAKDQYGKSVPVEYRSKNGAEVSIDNAHYGVDRKGNWASGPDAHHVGWQTPGKKNTVGHIILDSMPVGRPSNKLP